MLVFLILNLWLFNFYDISARKGLLFSTLFYSNACMGGVLHVRLNWLAHMVTCLKVMLILFRSGVDLLVKFLVRKVVLMVGCRMHKVCVNMLKRAHIFMCQRLKRCLWVLLNQRFVLERRRLGMAELGRFVVVQWLFVLVWLIIMCLRLF
jgi:hypothetical protein